jgi:hypothetical protein
MRPFVIFALPRSRTAWLGAFLSYKDWVCFHEPSVGFRTKEDIKKVLDIPNRGIADTNLALLWPHVVQAAPHARIVTVRRPLEEVLSSGEKLGFPAAEMRQPMERLEIALDEIERLSGTKRFEFRELDDKAKMKELFEFCLPYPFDEGLWQYAKQARVNAIPEHFIARALHNRDGVADTFGSAVAHYESLRRERLVPLH